MAHVKRRRVIEIGDLSAASVRKAAVAACGGDPALSIVPLDDDPAMVTLVHALGNWRQLVLAEQADAPLKLERAEYVAAIHTILRLGPAIARDHAATIQAVEELDPSSDPHVPAAQAALPEARASVVRQRTMIDAVAAVANDPRVVHPARWAALPIDTYSQFLPALAPLFSAIVIRVDGSDAEPQRPFFTFAATVLTVVTGKLVTEEMVRTHVTKRRSARWERPGWRGRL
jgi:hypothetical protein